MPLQRHPSEDRSFPLGRACAFGIALAVVWGPESNLPSFQRPQERSRAEQRAQPAPGRLRGSHPDAPALRCRSVCKQKHGAKVQTGRFHFPGAVHRAGVPRFQAHFFRPFTRLLLARCVIMLKKPKSSMSRRSNETSFPVDLFLLLEQLFKLNYKTVVPLQLLIAPLVITNPIS